MGFAFPAWAAGQLAPTPSGGIGEGPLIAPNAIGGPQRGHFN